MKHNYQFAIMLLLASAAVVAQESTPRVYRSGYEWIEESTGSLAAAKSLRIKTSSGAIQAQGNQQTGVTYTIRKHVRASSEEAARREFARLRVYAANSVEGGIIRGERENNYVRGSIDFDIQFPRQISFVRLETGNGHLLARNITGKVEAITGGSAIQLDEIGGDVHARSGGGDIEIGKAGGDVRVETGGGGIHVGSAGGRVFAVSGGGELSVGSAQAMVLQTGAGAIRVNKCTGEVTASTGGGSVDLSEVGHALVSSGGGSIKAIRMAGGLRVDTGSGPIVVDLAATRGSFTESRLETAAGDIVVYIPEDLGITIRAAVELANGEGIISKDFPALQVSHGSQQLGPREIWAEGSLNGGGPLLHVHTTTGTITFKRRETSASR